VKFVHEEPEFRDLLRIVADRVHIQPGLVEKDYWVTHVLWSLQAAGFDVWFKGGTSLSKGFRLIERFSEDLDLKLEAGRVAAIPHVTNWKSEGKAAVSARAAFFSAVAASLVVPGATVLVDPDYADATQRSARLRAQYPGSYLADLGAVMRPFVVLEIGSARVTPCVELDLGSFVHDELLRQGQLGAFVDNRPRAVRCVHPVVTLIEKLDALHRRVHRPEVAAASFVRHFEDAARIAAAEARLPPLADYATPRALAEDMRAARQIVDVPRADAPAFNLLPGSRKDAIERAHRDIAPMYWGPRLGVDDACAALRGWIASRL